MAITIEDEEVEDQIVDQPELELNEPDIEPEPDIEEDDAEPEAAEAEQTVEDVPRQEVYSLKGEKPKPIDKGPDSAPMKQMRDRIAELNKKVKEYEAKFAPTPEELQSKPRPKAADYNFDEDKHAEALIQWALDEEKIKAKRDAITKEQEEVNGQYAKRLALYEEQKAALGVDDFEEAQAAVLSKMSQNQVSAIIDTALRPAMVMHILGTRPDRLEKFAAEKNIGRLIAAVREMEIKEVVVKTETKPARPEPERGVQRSGAPTKGTVDAHLAKLEAEYEQTGDRTKIIAYNKKLREQKEQRERLTRR